MLMKLMMEAAVIKYPSNTSTRSNELHDQLVSNKIKIVFD